MPSVSKSARAPLSRSAPVVPASPWNWKNVQTVVFVIVGPSLTAIRNRLLPWTFPERVEAHVDGT